MTTTRRTETACDTAQKLAEARQPSCPSAVHVDGEVGQGAPEVDQRQAVARAAALQTPVVDLDLAVDDHVGRRRPEPGEPRCSNRPSSAEVRWRCRTCRAGTAAHTGPCPSRCRPAGRRSRRRVAWMALTGMLGSNTMTFGPRLGETAAALTVVVAALARVAPLSRMTNAVASDQARGSSPAGEQAAGTGSYVAFLSSIRRPSI